MIKHKKIEQILNAKFHMIHTTVVTVITRSNNKDSAQQRMQGWIRTREFAFGVCLPLSVRSL